jgi:hypothetical protein
MSRKSESQYHHYIPQFLLRRYAIAPPEGRKFRKELCRVNAVDLTKTPPEVSTVRVKQMFGEQDMYKDSLKSTPRSRNNIEEKLARIEQAASRIIARVVDAHTSGKDKISLSRADKNLLRKFLFVMKYRSPIFFKRFNHQTAEEYDSDDQDTFLKYMRAKGFTRPIDVWLDNLSKIIDTHMDADGRWIMSLFETIYPPDAIWLFMIFDWMHLAFVTPSDPEEEFVLTENAFSIHEGPTSFSTSRRTGKRTMKAYTEFHLLSIVSSSLAMVLRHNSLPEPFEDANPGICQQKRTNLAEQSRQHADPEYAASLLLDLPVGKATNPHVIVNNAWLVSGDGIVETPRLDDAFQFTFFRLKSRHVQMINAIMLDQARHSSSIVFNSTTALRTALEFYLDYPTQAKGGHSLKTITDREDDPMLLLFQKLEHTASSLGSHVKARYHVDPLIADPQQKIVHQASDIQQRFIGVHEQSLIQTEPNLKASGHISGFSKQGLKEAFDIPGCENNLNKQHTRLVASTPTAPTSTTPTPTAPTVESEYSTHDNDDDSFDEIITHALKVARPMRSNDPIVLMMVVMTEGLERMQLNIKALHALDTILEGDGRPSYPESVFNSLHSMERKNLNHNATILVGVELHVWKLGWDVLVQRALQCPGADFMQDLDNMRGKLKQLGLPLSRGMPLEQRSGAQVPAGPQQVVQTEKETDVGVFSASPTERASDKVLGHETVLKQSTQTMPTLVSDAEFSRVHNRAAGSGEHLQAMPSKTQDSVNVEVMKPTATLNISEPEPSSQQILLTYLAVVLLGYLGWICLR